LGEWQKYEIFHGYFHSTGFFVQQLNTNGIEDPVGTFSKMFNQVARTVRVVPESVGFKQVARETKINIVKAFDYRFAGAGGEIEATIDGEPDDLKYKALFEETILFHTWEEI